MTNKENNQLNEAYVLKRSLDHYWKKLDLDINNNELHAEGIEGYILLISEYWVDLVDKEKWLSNAWKLLKRLRDNLPKEIHIYYNASKPCNIV